MLLAVDVVSRTEKTLKCSTTLLRFLVARTALWELHAPLLTLVMFLMTCRLVRLVKSLPLIFMLPSVSVVPSSTCQA